MTSLKKSLLLARVTNKCSKKKSTYDRTANKQKAHNILLSAGAVAAAVILFFFGGFVCNFADIIGGVEVIPKALFVIVFVSDIIMAIKNYLNVLYMSEDLPILMTMPFSPLQIVSMRVFVASRIMMIVNPLIMIPFSWGIAYKIHAGISFWFGSLLMGITVPLTALAIVISIIILIMRFFSGIRNRDVLITAGSIAGFALYIAYMWANQKINSSSYGHTAAVIASTATNLSKFVPSISYLSRFIFDGNVFGLLISLGILLVILAICTVIIYFMYLPSALAMQNTSSNKKILSSSDIAKRTKKNSVKRAFMLKELRCVRRNPSYLIYGFLVTFLWPIFFLIVIMQGIDEFMNAVAEYSTSSFAVLLISSASGMAAGLMASGFNNIAHTSISREGASFAILKQLPIKYEAVLKGKRDAALLICLLGSATYIAVLGIVAIIFLHFPIWSLPISEFMCFCSVLIMVDVNMMFAVKKPNLSWENEADIARKLGMSALVAIISVFVIVFGAVFFIAFYAMLGNELIPVCISVAFMILYGLAAFLVNKKMLKYGRKRLIYMQAN